MAQKVHPIIWSQSNLPYDCTQVMPVPKPIGKSYCRVVMAAGVGGSGAWLLWGYQGADIITSQMFKQKDVSLPQKFLDFKFNKWLSD